MWRLPLVLWGATPQDVKNTKNVDFTQSALVYLMAHKSHNNCKEHTDNVQSLSIHFCCPSIVAMHVIHELSTKP